MSKESLWRLVSGRTRNKSSRTVEKNQMIDNGFVWPDAKD